ncbi:unnamed protein product [Fraxinus pennsylvanica]|uniref:Uncharacterized protein n=1 Tax=Fraxinus pennsylvanica TaxID=56036 RepID=A0AAD1YX33_9LAMI|nr:unnamed protein product [Fraxinus pennsylvanica]
MESNHKHRGFKKAKLVMSFYRAAKAASSSKVKPTPDPFNSFNANGIGEEHTAFILKKQDKVFPQQQKVTFVVPDDSYAKFDGIAADEAVDAKAASYISSVQARFRLQQMQP